MDTYSLTHVSDHVLLRDLAALVAKDRATTAALLAHIAEVDERRLYAPAAYPSMHAYCVHELGLSEDAASKRIQAARVARQFPAIFPALADGRLHLSGVCLLAPHLLPETADELLAAATHQSKSEIERMLARRFPRPDLLTRVEPISSAPAPTPLEPHVSERIEEQHAPGHVASTAPRARVAPLSPERFALQVTIGQATHDKLRHAQALLSHQVRPGDVAEVLDRALDALIVKLEKRKFAATDKPRPRRRHSTRNRRYIPAEIKRTVCERDQGQCTFVSETGRRCSARMLLEFDHVVEVARGGETSADSIRLRCRAHNQYEAARTFGTEFMKQKRQEGQRVRAARRARVAARADEARARAAAADVRAEAQDVAPWLRQLGFRADEARRAAEFCEGIPDAPLEERVRVALSHVRLSTPCRVLRHAAPNPETGPRFV